QNAHAPPAERTRPRARSSRRFPEPTAAAGRGTGTCFFGCTFCLDFMRTLPESRRGMGSRGRLSRRGTWDRTTVNRERSIARGRFRGGQQSGAHVHFDPADHAGKGVFLAVV